MGRSINSSLISFVTRHRNRLAVRLWLATLQIHLWWAALIILAVGIWNWWWRPVNATIWAGFVSSLFLLVTSWISVSRIPSKLSTVRLVDRHLGANSLLITAWDFLVRSDCRRDQVVTCVLGQAECLVSQAPAGLPAPGVHTAAARGWVGALLLACGLFLLNLPSLQLGVDSSRASLAEDTASSPLDSTGALDSIVSADDLLALLSEEHSAAPPSQDQRKTAAAGTNPQLHTGQESEETVRNEELMTNAKVRLHTRVAADGYEAGVADSLQKSQKSQKSLQTIDSVSGDAHRGSQVKNPDGYTERNTFERRGGGTKLDASHGQQTVAGSDTLRSDTAQFSPQEKLADYDYVAHYSYSKKQLIENYFRELDRHEHNLNGTTD